jgi:predicted ATP-grasp superfamily ATP-dependent carboligase
LLSIAPAGILSCRIIKPVKVVRKGFLTTPLDFFNSSLNYQASGIAEKLKLRL